MNFHSHPGFGKSSQLSHLDLDVEWCKTVHPNSVQKLLVFTFYTECEEQISQQLK